MEGLNTYRHTIAPLAAQNHPVLQQQRVLSRRARRRLRRAERSRRSFTEAVFPRRRRMRLKRPRTGKPYCDICRGGIRSDAARYDDATNGIRFNDLLATLNTLPARSIDVAAPCCPDPTGADLTPSMGCGDWK